MSFMTTLAQRYHGCVISCRWLHACVRSLRISSWTSTCWRTACLRVFGERSRCHIIAFFHLYLGSCVHTCIFSLAATWSRNERPVWAPWVGARCCSRAIDRGSASREKNALSSELKLHACVRGSFPGPWYEHMGKKNPFQSNAAFGCV